MVFDYVIFFGVLALSIILGTIYYVVCVFIPKSKKLEIIGDFKYNKNLNKELIHTLNTYCAEHKAFDAHFMNDLSFNTIITTLENWRDKVYTDRSFHILKQAKIGQPVLNNLVNDIQTQIKVQNEIKANYNKTLMHTQNRMAR